ERPMHIPDHVCRGKRSKSDKSSAILKHIILNLAAQHTERASIRSLSKLVGLEHSTICLYIRRGAFSESAAKRITEHFPNHSIKAADLMDPLALLGKSPG